MRKFEYGSATLPQQSSRDRHTWIRRSIGVGAVVSLCVATACSGPTSSSLSSKDTESAKTNNTAESQATVPVQRLNMEVTGEYQFFGSPFVQGLEFEADGSLLVGTGEYGSSEIYRLPAWATDPNNSHPEQVQTLDPALFGEGITKLDNGTVWQLTWKEGTAISRDGLSLKETGRAELNTQGWGACSFGDSLVTSDGSGTLTIRSADFTPMRTVPITFEGKPVTMLNELECVSDDISSEHRTADSAASARATSPRTVWANVWQTPLLYRINLDSGVVDGVLDTTELLQRIPTDQRDKIDVLNGIAAIPGALAAPQDTDEGSTANEAGESARINTAGSAVDGDFLLTGKRWPLAFSVRVR